MKTVLFKHTENFNTKTSNLSEKNSDIFHVSAQNIDCRYSLESPRQNRILRYQWWRPSWISDWNNFSYFWSASHHDTSYQVSSQLLAFWFRRQREKKRFPWWPHFSFSFINKLLRYFLSSFKTIGLYVQEPKGKIDFEDGGLDGHGLPIGTILAISLRSTSCPDTSCQMSKICLSVQEKKRKINY